LGEFDDADDVGVDVVDDESCWDDGACAWSFWRELSDSEVGGVDANDTDTTDDSDDNAWVSDDDD
jgi:hypothetical protein